MDRELQIKLIADEVNNTALIAPNRPSMRLTSFFVAIAQNLAEATYCGRKEVFSIPKFRRHMRIAAAYCQKAAGVITDIILRERLRQDKIWGDEFDRQNTANDWHAYVGHYIAIALQPGQDYAANMVKAAGICQAAILMVDRYGQPAPRHYESLHGAGAHCEHCGRVEGKDHVCPGSNTTIVNNVMLDKPKEEI